MDAWLVGTGLNVETLSTPVTDLLVEVGAFDIGALVLRIDDRWSSPSRWCKFSYSFPVR